MALARGSRFGDYLLGETLGQGGYGIVYSARDMKMDREIAVKILKADQVARPQVLKRFLQEARSAAKIVHPGIVTVYECGEVKGTGTGDDGTVFLAMELLTGENLGRRLKRGRMEIPLALDFAIQVASALEAAHNKGIVHRDLKPDNLFLVPDTSLTSGERVKVLDFGIAKLADTEDVTSVHTSSMTMMGTPKYMSPEQCRSTADVDHRTDIYSLGCILFEVLTGRTPFVGDAGEQIAKHQLEATPSTRALAPEVPKALDRLVVKMLAKRVEDRPASMAKVSEELVELAKRDGRGATGAQERSLTDRAATEADLPSTKAARMQDADGTLDLEKTQLDKTRADLAEVPRSSTNPEREATRAQSLDVQRPPWWRRREVVTAAFGAAVVTVVVMGVALGRGSSTPIESPPSTPPTVPAAPAAVKPVAQALSPPSCDAQVSARAWDQLLTCADGVADREIAKAMRAQATLESRNRDSLTKLSEALARKDHAEALVWLDRVDDTSVYRAEAVTTFAQALPKPEAALPGCNAVSHTTAAKAKLAVGQYREALVEIEASLRCTVDPSLYRLGALAACNGRNTVKARMFISKLPASQQTTIRQICLRNGVELP